MSRRRKCKGAYPSAWPRIAARVKDAAGWRCEHCGHPHDPASGHTLTVHHLDGDPANCADANLVALCQRCHLSIQATWRPGDPLPPAWEAVPTWLARRGLPYLKQERLL